MSNSSKKINLIIASVAATIAFVVLLYFFVFNKSAQFEKLIISADKNFASNQLNEARQLYNEALQIKPDEIYPKKRISSIDSVFNVGEIMERYTEKLNQADMFFSQGKYVEAREYYFEALNINSDDEYPVNQIRKIQDLLDEVGMEKDKRSKPEPISVVKKGLFFHIIVGVFEYNQNATKLLQRMKDEGRPSRIIERKDLNMKAVTYGSYNNIHEAYNYMLFVKEGFFDDAWVLYDETN